ncbi:unnamed protein product [Chondrus crispus]|uniref:Uncharacterized protein n=1 Tax=Chondrus crispus TaxID=2769 RepID=R7QL75_CHOCR|nr:unnamed protein product [Chondrus crispus]CDF39277.1 unnamed protein product [Chondrus crispus]|eukprot:XP_005719188.1 unnamed protein product [Chondrus crispus]
MSAVIRNDSSLHLLRRSRGVSILFCNGVRDRQNRRSSHFRYSFTCCSFGMTMAFLSHEEMLNCVLLSAFWYCSDDRSSYSWKGASSPSSIARP